MTYWLATLAMLLGALVAVTYLERMRPSIVDDGVRPVWIGHCGGIDYRWHYDPRTVPSGASCTVERVER